MGLLGDGWAAAVADLGSAAMGDGRGRGRRRGCRSRWDAMLEIQMGGGRPCAVEKEGDEERGG